MQLRKNRNFLILFSGQMVSVIGDNLFSIALLWYVLDVTHSKGAVAVTGFAETLPPIIGLFVGVFVDRWSKKYTMLMSDLIRAMILIGVYIVTLYSHLSLWLIVSAVVALGIAGTFFQPAQNALLPEVVTKDQFTRVSGLNQSMSAFASLGGMLGGGALIGWIGAPLMFLGDGLSFVVSVVSLLFVRVKGAVKETAAHSTSLWQEWVEGFRAIRKSRYLVLSVFTSPLVNFSLAGVGVALTVWVKEVLHGPALWLAFTDGAFLVGVMCGGLISNMIAKHFTYRWIQSLSLVALGAGLSLCGAWVNLYWAIAMMFVAGAGLSIGNSSGSAGLMAVIPEQVRGRVYATLGTTGRMSMPIGSAVLGLLIVHLPVGIVLVFTGLCPLIGAVSLLLPYSRKGLDEVEQALGSSYRSTRDVASVSEVSQS